MIPLRLPLWKEGFKREFSRLCHSEVDPRLTVRNVPRTVRIGCNVIFLDITCVGSMNLS